MGELACPDLSDLHMITFLLQKIFGETIIKHLIMNPKRKKSNLMIPLMNRRAKKNQKIPLMMIAIARLKKSCLNQQSASIKEKKHQLEVHRQQRKLRLNLKRLHPRSLLRLRRVKRQHPRRGKRQRPRRIKRQLPRMLIVAMIVMPKSCLNQKSVEHLHREKNPRKQKRLPPLRKLKRPSPNLRSNTQCLYLHYETTQKLSLLAKNESCIKKVNGNLFDVQFCFLVLFKFFVKSNMLCKC